MKVNKSILVALFALSITATCLACYSIYQTPRIGFVRTPELVYSYAGTREARKNFENEKRLMMLNLDTLKQIHFNLIQAFEAMPSSDPERPMQRAAAMRAAANVQSYEESINNKVDEMDERLMTGILNQVNSYAIEFGKKNRYDLILATTSSGNILYGKDADDLTTEMLEELNQQYVGSID